VSKKSVLDSGKKLVNPVVRARHQLIGLILVGVVFCAAIFFFYTSPSISSKHSAQAVLAQDRTALQTALTNLSSAQNGSTNTCLYYHQSQVLDSILPATEPVLTLGQISSIVSSSGLEVTTITPPGAVPNALASGVEYIPITIATEGTFDQFEVFLSSLTNHNPIITVSSSTFTDSTVHTGKFDISIVMNLWWYPKSPALPLISGAKCSAGTAGIGVGTTPKQNKP
jgi:Tfp pilus assembly protein PilO